MFMFANPRGQVLISATAQPQRVMFNVPEITGFNALIETVRLTPKPVISILGTLGGANYLNVFGEDPVQIELTGYVVGYNCGSASEAESAIGNSVALYRANGVVNRVSPFSFTLPGADASARDAFLVAMSITQDNAFADIAQFTMVLLAEDFNTRRILNPASSIIAPKQVATPPSNNTGVPGAIPSIPSNAPDGLVIPADTVLLDSSGNVVSPRVVNLTDERLTPTGSNIR